MIRWTAIVHYRTDAGIVDVTHDLSEIAELHDRVVDRRKGRSAMTRLLSLFGLMRVSEHERSVRALESQLVLRENAFETIEGERDRLSDKFKQAVADLEKQAEEIAGLQKDVEIRDRVIGDLNEMIDDLRLDALAMRRKRQMDRDRRKGNG